MVAQLLRTLTLLLGLVAAAPSMGQEGSKPSTGPTITSIMPSLGYPDEKGLGSFVVMGTNFDPAPGATELFLDNRPERVDWTGKDPSLIHGKFISPARLEFSNIPMWARRGKVQVQLQVGTVLTNASAVTLSGVGRWSPLAIAGLATIVLIGLVVAIALSRKAPDAGSRLLRASARFLLDPETETYSLSRFQFYAWTLAAIFGYIYLVAVWSLVRGKLVLPPIPQNMPGIIFISAATSIAATGITASRGPKGAGDVHPSLSDLISTGAVVAPERVQFFVWTVLGVLSFLFFSVIAEPGTLDNLPAVPQEFLYLGGVSAFGYLGGKLTRKPGPIIEDCIAAIGSLKVQIRGRNLSPSPQILINSTPVPYDRFGTTAGEVRSGATLRMLQADDQSPELASVLELVIQAPSKEWIDAIKAGAAAPVSPANTPAAGLPVLTLVNADGQRASWPIALPRITAPNPPVPLAGVVGSAFDIDPTLHS